ncbi:MAG: hypothetical protein Q8P57_04690 [Candidatus Pacearchaeota archaeon]|nr:hypothetical protein [Candidatus Pacearchaeota archaeon]
MGFFDLFRKKPEEVEIKKVKFDELPSLIEDKLKDIGGENEKYMGSVKGLVNQLVMEINEGVLGLKNINWDRIKAEERVKKIVQGNLRNYISHLDGLRMDLESLDVFERKKIDSVFDNFDRRARMSYEKSTFLIGKEIGVISDSVVLFFKNLDKIEKDNKKLVESFEVISKVKEDIKELDRKDGMISNINNGIKEIAKRKEELKEGLIKFNKKIEDVKGSELYRKWLAKNEEYNNSKNKLNSMLLSLRGIVDFKKMGKVWHENKSEMEIVKNYRDDFRKEFSKDMGVVLRRLVNSLENKDLINEKINEILELTEKVGNFRVEKSPVSDIEVNISRARNEIEGLNSEKERDEKRKEKVSFEMEKIKKDIKNGLWIIGVEVS